MIVKKLPFAIEKYFSYPKGGILMGLSIREDLFGLITTLQVSGHWDTYTRQQLAAFIEKMEFVDLLILDFSELQSIDSSFMEAILAVANSSLKDNYTLKFKGISSLIREIFENNGIYTSVTSIYEKVV
jgi:anti-anti-sigma regulatory factor